MPMSIKAHQLREVRNIRNRLRKEINPLMLCRFQIKPIAMSPGEYTANINSGLLAVSSPNMEVTHSPLKMIKAESPQVSKKVRAVKMPSESKLKSSFEVWLLSMIVSLFQLIPFVQLGRASH